MSTTIDDELKALKEKQNKEKEELDKLEKLKELYPDLEVYTGRWNKKVYSSKLANASVDSYDERYNCGCCGDSPLEIWPYKETENGRIYSSPAKFTIANRNDFQPAGYVLYDNWKDVLVNADLNKDFINKAFNMFEGYNGLLYKTCEDKARQIFGADYILDLENMNDGESYSNEDWWGQVGVKTKTKCSCGQGEKDWPEYYIEVKRMPSKDSALKVLIAALEEYEDNR